MHLDTLRTMCDKAGMPVNPDTTVRKNVSMPKELWEEVQDFRFSMRIGSESGAILRLLKLGLEAAKQQEKAP